MNILHLSDTHGCHRRLQDLPEADVVVHSGDFCMVGRCQEQDSIKEMTIRLERRPRHVYFRPSDPWVTESNNYLW